MDFYQIRIKETKNGGYELYPDFIVGRSKDLMVQGRTFYAIWDEERGLWSRDEYDVQRLVDEDLVREAQALTSKTGLDYSIKYMNSFNSNSWTMFRRYLAHISDNNHALDTNITFANTEVRKTDYVTKRLPYNLQEGDIAAWDELVGTLYSAEERQKIEWAIGSIISGDSKNIQKFLVFYGAAGTGKSTILNIIQKLFEGYTTSFDGKALGSNNSSFATEAFKHNPLVAIQHDGDLSKIEDNTRLNSIVSHEYMMMNEKYKPGYTARVNSLLFMGSNQPVKISDSKSGLIRRLIDVHPTGVKIPIRHYSALLQQIDFELGAIAHHCYQVYLSMGKNYYNNYRPLEMMFQTDVFFNFIEAYYDLFKSKDAISIKEAYKLYKEFCLDSGIDKPLPQYKVREELRNYFDTFRDRGEIDGEAVRSVYSGFNAEKFKVPSTEAKTEFSLVMEETESLLDEVYADQLAQLASPSGTLYKKWADVKTHLSDIDTSLLHWVRVPQNNIIIDFDLKELNGHTALERNLEAASGWPPTYGEISRSGTGVHLHYVYEGDVGELASEFASGIEIKVFTGDSSLRRQLTRCNNVPISTISSGLPLKQSKGKMLQEKTIKSEKGLRELIERNLKKEIHPGTKPSVDFIHKILEDAYESGMPYDVTDMRTRILAFAINSTHQSSTCVKTVQKMKFSSSDQLDSEGNVEVDDKRIVFFDVEVYKNLFVVCWKFQGADEVVQMVNPKSYEVEELFKLKLVGFYNRRYDNHILYAASMGYTNEQLFDLSWRMISNDDTSKRFAAAYNLSYADIWDFSTVRQGLKKFEIDLGLHHMELDLPWDEPVDEKDWPRVVEYCVNDVRATEAVFEDRKGDFIARQILAELSGLTVNDTTQRHTAKIIFGEDKEPQTQFIYTNLNKEFPGYTFEYGKSLYKGIDPGEGGYVYAEPGIYSNVAVLDVASMHPTTIKILKVFGPYTEKFADLTAARVAIKRKDYKTARSLLDGRLTQFLEGAEEDPHTSEALAYALKIAINIVYGLTSAKFENPFRDIRNVDNIVAKRGALFMIDLMEALRNRDTQVIHIKTDSVKIPLTNLEMIDFIIEFGREYGYEFEHEVTYDKFCLVNDAVYIARHDNEWTAVGSQFAHPYVYKSLFSYGPIEFDDYCETKNVTKGTMYLDKEEHEKGESLDFHRMRHLGRTGRFVPVLEGGGTLYRVQEDRYYAVAGTKGHHWIDADIAKEMPDLQIDMSYFEKLKDDAVKAIEQFGSFDEFVN